LAAAFAESGDFEAAIKTATQAVERIQRDEAARNDIARHLESYKEGKPWREIPY
jgi:hypothetical protein